MGCTVATWPTRGFETLGSAIPTWVFYRARVGAGRVSGSGFTSLTVYDTVYLDEAAVFVFEEYEISVDIFTIS